MYRLYLDRILIFSSLLSPATTPEWPLLRCHSGRLVIFPMCVPAWLNYLSARPPVAGWQHSPGTRNQQPPSTAVQSRTQLQYPDLLLPHSITQQQGNPPEISKCCFMRSAGEQGIITSRMWMTRNKETISKTN